VGGFGAPGGAGLKSGPTRADTDQVMDELRELLDRHGEAEPTQGEVAVRWAYEVIAPALAGAVLLLILLVTG
jgi:hypothetical protein